MRKCSGVLCSGSIVYDILVRPVDQAHWGTTTFVDSIDYRVGGNGANTSRALAIIGVPVRLLGMVGRDEQARFVLDRIEKSGVDISAVQSSEAATATSVAIVNNAGDRKFLHRLGASDLAFAEPLEFTANLIEGRSHYHLASLFVLPKLRAHAGAMLQQARAAGLTTSLDTNWDAQGRWMRDLEPCLPHLDMLFMNEDEARMVTGSSDPKAAAAVVLGKGVHTAVMKLSGRGCAIYTADAELLCPAYDVNAADTTGAGDCFVAGFLSSVICGASLTEAGQFANAAAALSVQQIGAVEGMRSRAGISEWMKSAKLRSPTCD